MSKKLANFRLPSDLLEALEIRAKEQGISKTELLESFIRQGLGLNVKQDVKTNSFTVNQDSFTDVNQDVNLSVKQLVKQEVTEAVEVAIATHQQAIAKLQQRLEALEAQQQSTKQAKATSDPVPRQAEKVGEAVEVAIAEPHQGLTQTELCKKFRIDATNVAKRAKKAGMNSEEFLARETGWRKEGRLWYAPSE